MNACFAASLRYFGYRDIVAAQDAGQKRGSGDWIRTEETCGSVSTLFGERNQYFQGDQNLHTLLLYLLAFFLITSGIVGTVAYMGKKEKL